jgi:hypothetical protein
MLPDSLPVHHELPARHVHMDAATVANLELENLVKHLDHTVTKGGGKFIGMRPQRLAACNVSCAFTALTVLPGFSAAA